MGNFCQSSILEPIRNSEGSTLVCVISSQSSSIYTPLSLPPRSSILFFHHKQQQQQPFFTPLPYLPSASFLPLILFILHICSIIIGATMPSTFEVHLHSFQVAPSLIGSLSDPHLQDRWPASHFHTPGKTLVRFTACSLCSTILSTLFSASHTSASFGASIPSFISSSRPITAPSFSAHPPSRHRSRLVGWALDSRLGHKHYSHDHLAIV